MTILKSPAVSQLATHLIIVMGVSGSGKSTLAEALAASYSYQYLDADSFHSEEARALMAAGIPLTDEHRAPWVAQIKERLISNASSQIHTVLAFSGLKKKHRQELRSAGLNTLFLFLSADQNVIHQRLCNRTGHFMSPSLLKNQFENLESPLAEADVYELDVLPDLSNVIEQAKGLIDTKLLGKKTFNN